MSSVVFALHISQFVYPSVCLRSMLNFKVPVLALNKVAGDGTRFTLLFMCELSLLCPVCIQISVTCPALSSV